MAPLPLRPEFPVFGLSDSFPGFRWLLSWQRRNGPWEGDVTEVSLGHGHPDDGPFIVVHTALVKRAGQDLGGDASPAAVAVEYVASNGVINAVAQAMPDSDQARALIGHELRQIHQSDAEVALVGWRVRPVSIDGSVYPGRLRQVGVSWVIVIERPIVVIGVSGPAESFRKHGELADVSAHLGDYAAGTNESGDSPLF